MSNDGHSFADQSVNIDSTHFNTSKRENGVTIVQHSSDLLCCQFRVSVRLYVRRNFQFDHDESQNTNRKAIDERATEKVFVLNFRPF